MFLTPTRRSQLKVCPTEAAASLGVGRLRIPRTPVEGHLRVGPPPGTKGTGERDRRGLLSGRREGGAGSRRRGRSCLALPPHSLAQRLAPRRL